MKNNRPRFRAAFASVRIFAWLLLFAGGGLMAVAQPRDTLTNAADILALTAKEASNQIPIRVTGVVTTAEPTWGGRFFVQDASGSVFVDNRTGNQPAPGGVVEVWGISHPGGYAPDINRSIVTGLALGNGARPSFLKCGPVMSGA